MHAGLRRTVFLLLALLMMGLLANAVALELKTNNGVTPFDDNPITVISEKPGTLTIRARAGDRELENPVTEQLIWSGTTELSWQALTYNEEPLHKGVTVTLTATLIPLEGETETAEASVRVYDPMAAVTACLPATERYYPGTGETLLIEVLLSRSDAFMLEMVPVDNPENVVWQHRIAEGSRNLNQVTWNGRIGSGKNCPPGDYILTASARSTPGIRKSHRLTILAEPELSPQLEVSAPLLPEDPEDEAAVWEILTAPMAVGAGGEAKGLHILLEKNARYGKDAGTCNCRTVGLRVLEVDEDGWVKVGAWRQQDGAYVEGYVSSGKIRMVRPNTHYGAVVDRQKQIMTVYEDGRKIGSMLISTGLVTEANPRAETRAGAYLIGTRMDGFNREGFNYLYPMRIDGTNLLHQVGYKRKDGTEDFSEQLAELGSAASHGCVRMDMQAQPETGGINAWWIWTHLEKNTKILVLE